MTILLLVMFLGIEVVLGAAALNGDLEWYIPLLPAAPVVVIVAIGVMIDLVKQGLTALIRKFG